MADEVKKPDMGCKGKKEGEMGCKGKADGCKGEKGCKGMPEKK
jgi:hypothetical protein